MKTWNVKYKLGYISSNSPIQIVQIFANTSNEAVNKAKSMTVYPLIKTYKNQPPTEPEWNLISVSEFNACEISKVAGSKPSYT